MPRRFNVNEPARLPLLQAWEYDFAALLPIRGLSQIQQTAVEELGTSEMP